MKTCPRCGYVMIIDPPTCTHCNWAGGDEEAEAVKPTLTQRAKRAMKALTAIHAHELPILRQAIAREIEAAVAEEHNRCVRIAEAVLVSSRNCLRVGQWSEAERVGWEERHRAASDILASIHSGVEL